MKCQECDNEVSGRKRFCQECARRHRGEFKKAKILQRVNSSSEELPLCSKCGLRRINPKYYLCTICQCAEYEEARRRRAANIEAMLIEERPRCKDCNLEAVQPGYPRCSSCQRLFRLKNCQKLRLIKKQKRLELNPILKSQGKKICSVCLYKKVFSEYSKPTKYSTELNDICDLCLTKLYCSRDKGKDSFNPVFWRKLAASTNGGALSRMRKQGYEGTRQTLDYKASGEDLAEKHHIQDGKCTYCGTVLTVDNISVDHTNPMALDGKHAKDNITLVCLLCQRMKWDHTKDIFEDMLKTLVESYMCNKLQNQEIKSS